MKTPYYVIHKKEMEQNLGSLKKALDKYWMKSMIGYSFKTNSLPWIITFMKYHGSLAEVVSEDEYALAKKLGYRVDEIIYNGLAKSKKTFIEAVKGGAIVNIDSKRELEWLVEAGSSPNYNIGLRVNFNIESECIGETQCGSEDGRFGFCYENGELEQALIYMNDRKISVSGLHLHCSSKTRSLNIYAAIVKKTVDVIKKYNLKLNFIDVGGGFFGGLPGKPSFDDYLKVISEGFSPFVDIEETLLIIEPDMSVVGAYIDYVTSVMDVKETLHNRFIVTDGSRTNIDPLMNKSSYFYEVLRKNEERKIIKKQTISGFTCMEHDRLFQLKNEKDIQREDQIIYHKVGAYTLCLTPLFIQFFPTVYVEENEKYYCVRRKWTEDDYLAGSSLYGEV